MKLKTMKLKSIHRHTLPALAVITSFVLAACGEKSDTGSTASEEKSDYPLTTCVVSGEELGSMGKPIEMVHEGITVKLCCKSCIDEFNADPAKFAAMVKPSDE